MTQLTFSDISEGSEFWEVRDNQHCKMTVTDGPFHVASMVAGNKVIQHCWRAIPLVDADEADTDEAGTPPTKRHYIVTDGIETDIEMYSNQDELPELEDGPVTVHININDLFDKLEAADAADAADKDNATA